MDLVKEHPFAELLGLEVGQVSAGLSAVSLKMNQSLLNPHGVAHGAVLYALADTGMGAALYPTLHTSEICATVEIKINYFKAVGDGQLHCKTKMINRGKRMANLESEVFQDDVLVAKANGNFAIFKPRAMTVD